MSRERVVVVLEYRIYVYNFSDLNLLHTIETISNPHGLCALCADSQACVIACCGLQKGHVRAELFDITRTTLISAHEAALSCIALNTDGTRLATGAVARDPHLVAARPVPPPPPPPDGRGAGVELAC